MPPGAPTQRLIGCTYELFVWGLCIGACVLALIRQLERGLAMQVGLGCCAGRRDGPPFSFSIKFFRFPRNFSLIGLSTLENCAFSFEILENAALHASPSDGGDALWSDLRWCRAVACCGQ